MFRFPVVGIVSPRIHQRVFVRHEFVHQALENLPAVHFQRDATDAELILRVVHQVVRPNGSTHTPPSPHHTGRSIGRDRECLGRPSGVYPTLPRTSIQLHPVYDRRHVVRQQMPEIRQRVHQRTVRRPV